MDRRNHQWNERGSAEHCAAYGLPATAGCTIKPYQWVLFLDKVAIRNDV
jgi:hypothetical protein